MPKVYTYEELLTEDYQTFGYFANKMGKTYKEVRDYFLSRSLVDLTINIQGVYVRRNIHRNLADDVKVRK